MKNSVKGILKTCVALGLCAVLAVGGYHLYKHWDKVTDWFNGIFHKEDPAPDKPTQPEGEQIKDFTFSGNQITGYIGSEVVLDNLPTSYSMQVGEVEEVLEITVEDMSDEDAMRELSEKVENGSFYCTPNDNERFFSSTYESWEEYMAEHYPGDEETKAFPMKFEFCSVTYLTGDDIKVTKIADGAFSGNTILSKIVIPNQINEIGQQAFENCENLTEINIPEGITEIKYQTFYGCKNLENIALPDSLTSIGHGAFDLTAIKSLTIPANVSNLDMLVSDKSALEELQIKSTLINPEQITSLASFASNLKIYVPDDYYLANYESYFELYLDNIFPINGTYPDEPEPEPEPEPSGEIVKMDNLDNRGTTTIYLNSDVETFTMPLVIGTKYIYSDVRTYNSVDDLIADKDDLISSYQGCSYCYTEPNGSDFVLFSFGDSSSIEYTVEQWISLNNQFPFKVAKFDIEYYDMTNVSYEDIQKFVEDNTITDVSKTTYSDYFSGMSLVDFTYATNLKEIILPDNPTGTSLIHSNQFATAKNVNVILESTRFLTIYDNQPVHADESVNFYVPDELYEQYVANEYWQELANQIHPMSELAEG